MIDDIWFWAFLSFWTLVGGCVCIVVDKANRAAERGVVLRVVMVPFVMLLFPILLLYHTVTVRLDEFE